MGVFGVTAHVPKRAQILQRPLSSPARIQLAVLDGTVPQALFYLTTNGFHQCWSALVIIIIHFTRPAKRLRMVLAALACASVIPLSVLKHVISRLVQRAMN